MNRHSYRRRQGAGTAPQIRLFETLETRALLSGPPYVPSLLAEFGNPATTAQFQNAIGTDAGGNVYIVGSFDKTIDLDPRADSQFLLTSGNGGEDNSTFLAKYTPQGNFVWANQFDGEPGDSIADAKLAVAPDGTCFLAYSFTGIVDADPGVDSFLLEAPFNGTDPQANTAVVRINPSGNFSTAVQFSTRGQETIPIEIALDGAGQAYVLAESFVDSTTAGADDDDTIVYGLSAYLDTRYTYRAGARHHAVEANDLAVNPDGSVYVVGKAWTGTDFHLARRVVRTIPHAFDDRNGYVLRLGPAGQLDWVIGLTGGTADAGTDFNAVAADGVGGVYVTGKYTPGVDFNPSKRHKLVVPTFNNRFADGFVARYAPTGRFSRAWNLGPVGDLYAPDAITVDPSTHNILVAGSLETQGFDVDPTGGRRLTEKHTFSSFYAVYTPRGRYVDAQAVSGVGLSIVPAHTLMPAFAPDGALYLLGRSDDDSLLAYRPTQADQTISLATQGLFVLKA
jgi:hypothetical protein